MPKTRMHHAGATWNRTWKWKLPKTAWNHHGEHGRSRQRGWKLGTGHCAKLDKTKGPNEELFMSIPFNP